MKVIQIMPEFGLAGAEIMCEALLIELKRANYDVIAVSMFDYKSPITERLEAEGIRIVYMGKRMGLDFSMIQKMIKLFKLEKPDVIHTHRYVMQYAIPAAIVAKVPVRVHTVHNVAHKEVGMVARKLAWVFYHYCNVVPVALSNQIKNTVLDEYDVKEDKVPVVFNGINVDRYKKKQCYYMEKEITFINIGRLSEQKNQLALIKAFSRLSKEYEGVRLQIIGSGNLLKEIEDSIKIEKIQEKVTLIGNTDDVSEYLVKSDCFILPSLYEGLPMTILEAMASGVPIIASNVGGVGDVLQHKVNSYLVEPSVEDIYTAMKFFIKEKDMFISFAEQALCDSKLYSSHKMAEKYINIYERELIK